jgi:squalene-hopene/tetraprenyl-beta-curcumene cyclase
METDTLTVEALDAIIENSLELLLSRQHSDGYWAFELETDTTITAEYILLNHFLNEIDNGLEGKLAIYIRRNQNEDGGWPLYKGGEFNISASVKAYFALKMVGDGVDMPHMRSAREAILAHGGAVNCNVFTRITLALFRQIPWRAVPVTRIEVMFAPKWFPIHINKVSYWTRTVMVPLLILTAQKPAGQNPRGVNIDELFHKPPYRENYKLTNPTGKWIGSLMLALDRFFRPFEPLIPNLITQKSIALGLKFMEDRSNDEDGLGGIFPAIANSLMVFDYLGYKKDDPRVVSARKAINKLLVIKDDEAYCQPCLSPVWDTGLSAHAILEAHIEKTDLLDQSFEWLNKLQILDQIGDWAHRRKNLKPGGWAFQYRNDFYPDVDDTAVVAMALHRQDPKNYAEPIKRAEEWIIGMQSSNGGWAAFDVENEHYLLENMPFADHGALLDPPTSDVTARCVSLLGQIGYRMDDTAISKGISFLKREQEKDGSWFGRWGTNYIYGTWSVLSALNMIGEDMSSPYVRRAVNWLISRQREDGGWGEDCATYWQHRKNTAKASMPSQTAWAVLGLIASGEVNSETVARGVYYLINQNNKNTGWEDEYFNAVGFPRVFYLKYHGYSLYFPLLALARYKRLKPSNIQSPKFGI